jgi:site-specific DNA recombinase
MQEERRKNGRAVIYTRVSSKEQVEGTSLGTQKERCFSYCKEGGLEIDQVFVEEGESAKVMDRTQLKQLLVYCERNKGKITHLVIWKFDRFARNQADHYYLRKKFAELGITVKSVTEPLEDTSIGKFQEGMISVFNEYDNNIRRDRCIIGTQEKMRSGIWCRKPPIGYIIPKKLGAKEKKMLPDIPDPERFDLLKEGWEMLLTGKYTVAEITRRINAKGLVARNGKKVYEQLLQIVFVNKFYCGILTDPWTKEEYAGLHKPMITELEFALAQQILRGRGNAFISKKLLNPDFPLRGSVKCGECNNYYTGSWSKGRTEKHAYYHCYNKKEECLQYGKSIKRAELEDYFMQHLQGITPKPEFLDRFEEVVVKTWKEKYKQVNEDYIKFDKKLDSLKEYKSKLVEKNARGILPDEEFAEAFARVKEEVELLELAKNDSKLDMFELEATIAYSKHFITDLPRQWFDLGIENKKRFQKLLFPEGLPYIGNKRFGTAKLSVVFQINQELQTGKTSIVGPARFELATKRL